MSQKILVIDDSLASSKAAETALAQNFGNVDVLLAQRATEGFDRFLVAQPDMILLNETFAIPACRRLTLHLARRVPCLSIDMP